MTATPWFVYIIKTRLNTLYTGVTTDLTRRFDEHTQGKVKGARYLKGKGPLQLVWSESVLDKRMAMQVEYRIKQLSRVKKDQLVSGKQSLQTLFKDVMQSK
ncbi:GIY-YIG nuclease family protein [Rhodanobacter aciditrophus]|uniref:GIY-YIG nuclease family protein n=1 Tax=Rhodanobacter aciditrophus TaxID=1623218 RepID=A0ABW4B3X5_9GAMM